MGKLNKDLSIDNIKLIYEFNKTSPLFSRVAHYEISNGNYLYALDILDKGIENHPDYASAYFIYALAKAYAGDEHHAREAVEKGNELIKSAKTSEFYNKKIDEIIIERNSLTDTKRPAFLETPDEQTEENEFFNFEERLEILAEELSKAKIKVNIDDSSKTETTITEYKGKKIASETLAGIYMQQKKYDDAIAIYYELMKQHPEKENYYAQKIVEIETLM